MTIPDQYKPVIEAAKEVGRYVILFLLSGLLVQLVEQLGKVPESTTINIWVFAVNIPIRLAFQLLFTAIGRFIDKAMYEKSKITGETNIITKVMSLG
ncbi:MAG: hypothetical protein WA019_05190 [Candidatus Moraniibacteriota bacterium]